MGAQKNRLIDGSFENSQQKLLSVTEAYLKACIFIFSLSMDSNIQQLEKMGALFQADESMVGYLHAEMIRLFRKFMGKFVKTKVITAANNITEVDFTNPDNQHPDDILAVGMSTRTYSADNPDTAPEKIKSFYR